MLQAVQGLGMLKLASVNGKSPIQKIYVRENSSAVSAPKSPGQGLSSRSNSLQKRDAWMKASVSYADLDESTLALWRSLTTYSHRKVAVAHNRTPR